MQALTSTPKMEFFPLSYAAFDYIIKSIDSRPLLQKNLNSVVIKTRSDIGRYILIYSSNLFVFSNQGPRGRIWDR